MRMNYAFRLAVQDDLDAIYTLNTEAFAESWSRDSFEHAWAVGYDIVVCVDENKTLIAYYLALSVFDEKQIMQLTVSKNNQKQGVGFALMRFVMDLYHQYAFFLEVRVSNQAAVRLYQKLGFQHIGCRKNYYKTSQQGGREDALLMGYKTTQLSSNQIGQ